jgi:hypothetical protein
MAFEQQEKVQQTGDAVTDFLAGAGDPARLKAELGNALLVEDTNFHTFQAYETACRQFGARDDPAERRDCLVAAARYMAAHYPTRRSREQPFAIAAQLLRGERVDAADAADDAGATTSVGD